ncbi:hypothetical protein [Algoriphagus persicinus]|uniref:hypothetical protein n=1 Tax=Algoriphagus persicinus TaxID=3108754 RepID=UPI002B3ABC07|nr:hypothetical protein [Algoriphagus sp. E1-3-M2]MEB2786613.1 hypothetical protein [Algoriphagus sp. E1-3-M2]
MLKNHDLGFLPESTLVDKAIINPVEYGHEFQPKLGKLIEINGLALQPFDQINEELSVDIATGNSLEKH